jgi:hypothetical protein
VVLRLNCLGDEVKKANQLSKWRTNWNN